MSLSKMASLNTMPTEVLSCVLNNRAIPLRHRLTLRLLSNRWANVIEEGLAKETALVIRDDGNEEFEHNEPSPDDLQVTLVIKSVNLTDQLFQLLARLYPAPTKLAIYFGNEVSWFKLPSLLTHLATNCSSIKLFGHKFPFYDFPGWAIADSLSALPALTSLFLMGFRITYNLLPLLAPVVTSRLVKFSCLFGWQYTPSLSFRCTHLMIPFNDFVYPIVFRRQVSTHLTHLHLVFCDDVKLKPLYKMPNLTSLGLVFEDFTYDSDSSPFRHLAPLAKRIPSLAVIKLFKIYYWSLLALLSKPGRPMPNIKWLTLLLIFDHEFIVDKKVNTPHEFANFFRFIHTFFPTLTGFTLICARDFHDELQATLKEIEIPFSVVILDSQLCKPYNAPW